MVVLRLKSFNLIEILATLGVIIIVALIVWIALWEFGILKKETALPEDLEKLKKELDYLNNYKFQERARDLQTFLPSPQIIEIPQLDQNEIGKQYIFEQ